MSEKSLAEMMAEQEAKQKAAEDARKKKAQEIRAKAEQDGSKSPTREKTRSPRGSSGRAEKEEPEPSFSVYDIPVQTLRGLLFILQGRMDHTRDKKALRRELKRYVKYDENLGRLVEAIRQLSLLG